MHKAFQETMSLLPVYFDRVHAFATPFYGFDACALWQQQQQTHPGSSRSPDVHTYRTDWDAVIIDFLKRQEKLGGPSMALAIVLKAQATGNLHVERGFRLETVAEAKEERDPRVLWPAVYLRSTMHLAASSYSVRSSPHNSGVLRLSQSSILSNWSSSNNGSAGGTTSSPFSINRKRPTSVTSPTASDRKSTSGSIVSQQQHHYSVLEYAPDSGTATSWPHNDWDALVATLMENDAADAAGQRINPKLRGIGYIGADNVGSSSGVVDDIAAPIFIAPFRDLSSRMASNRVIKAFGRHSTFHAMALGDWLHVVVLVKDKEDDSRWHRRRVGMDDSEIRIFLSDSLACHLCPRGIFSSLNRAFALQIEMPEKRLTIPCSAGTSWANEKQVQDFLDTVKQIFGLRPVSPLAKESNRTYSFYGTPRSPSSRGALVAANSRAERHRRLTKARQTKLSDSAVAFFLGPELAPSLK
jgi:hypothetical protein